MGAHPSWIEREIYGTGWERHCHVKVTSLWIPLFCLTSQPPVNATDQVLAFRGLGWHQGHTEDDLPMNASRRISVVRPSAAHLLHGRPARP